MQKERLQQEIIAAIYRLDYVNLKRLNAFIDDLKSIKVGGEEAEYADHENG
jgi:hypothetical protein